MPPRSAPLAGVGAEGSHVHLEERLLVLLTGRGLDLLGEFDDGLEMRIVLLLL